MNILFVAGSARKNGSTRKIIGMIEKELLSLGQKYGESVAIDKIDLGAAGLEFCRGCRACFEKGEEFCPCKDSAPELKKKMEASDGVILASPVYAEDVSGLMKTFIDRLTYMSYRPVCPGKTALCFTTSGVGSSGHAAKTMTRALGIWGFSIRGRYNFRTGAHPEEENIRMRYSKRLKKISGRFFHAIRDKKALKPSFVSLLMFTVQQASWRKAAEPKMAYSRAYWKDRGMLDKGATFYIPHRANPVKTAAARLFGKLIAVFFV
jgi:multimeric flavodoxin WrbA